GDRGVDAAFLAGDRSLLGGEGLGSCFGEGGGGFSAGGAFGGGEAGPEVGEGGVVAAGGELVDGDRAAAFGGGFVPALAHAEDLTKGDVGVGGVDRGAAPERHASLGDLAPLGLGLDEVAALGEEDRARDHEVIA